MKYTNALHELQSQAEPNDIFQFEYKVKLECKTGLDDDEHNSEQLSRASIGPKLLKISFLILSWNGKKSEKKNDTTSEQHTNKQSGEKAQKRRGVDLILLLLQLSH